MVAALGAFALELVGWPQDEIHRGPFAAEAVAGSRAVSVTLQDQKWRFVLRSRGDSVTEPSQSDLKLWIDGHELGPAHALHDDIRKGNPSAFSPWGDYVIFSLPAGVENSPATRARVVYSLRPPAGIAGALAVTTILFWLSLYWRRLRETLQGNLGTVAVRCPYLILRVFGYAGVAAAVLYLACTAYAFASGWALPTTSLIRWFSIGAWAARNEPMLPYVLLMLAGLGVAAVWLASLIPGAHEATEREEAAVLRQLRQWGFLIVACALVFSVSAIWAGIVRPGDLNYFSIGGLVTFSDAGMYMAGAHDQARDGVWNAISERRPFAAAFRTVLLALGNFNYANMLLVQALLLAAVTCFAVAAVARWRGIWAALAFFALIYICERSYIPTATTEPAGLFWALFSVPFFIEALRTGARAHALIALAATTLALMSRMGSMLTIPALMLWMIWRYGPGLGARVRTAILSVAVVFGVLGVNFVLEKIYGSGQQLTGSNFSYVACGLTIGTNWTGGVTKISAEGGRLPDDEKEATQLLYSVAWENFNKNPSVLFERLFLGAREFLETLPDTLWKGYLFVPDPPWLPRTLLSLISVFGIFHVLTKQRVQSERLFWLLLWTSVVSSAALIFFDDGRRTLVVSYPLFALFFASGFAGPRTPAPVHAGESYSLVRKGAGTFAAAVLLFLCVPWLVHRFSPAKVLAGDGLVQKANEAVVFGGSRMSGILVIPDDAPLRTDVPALHLSSFARIIEQSTVENSQGLLNPERPPLPFGFISAPRLESGAASSYLFIVPPEVLERRDVPAWRFTISSWQPKPNAMGYGPYWFQVTHAEPLR